VGVEVRSEIVDVVTAAGVMAIVRKRPGGEGSWPRIVMFHDGPGIRSATHRFAAKLGVPRRRPRLHLARLADLRRTCCGDLLRPDDVALPAVPAERSDIVLAGFNG
jgi:hypothetical protein